MASVARRRLPPTVRVVPYQEADLEELGLSREEAAETAWWIDADGRRRPGHEAFAGALQAMGGLWEMAGRVVDLPILRPIASDLYDLVSRNRGKLPGGPPDVR